MIQKIKEKFMNKQFLSFGLIGLFNTFLTQFLYLIFVKYSIAPFMASILADVLGICVSYILNMKFTYHQKMTLKNAISFPISYIPGTLISSFIVWVIVDLLHLPKYYAKAISLPITIPINYLFMTFVVNASSKKKDNG